MGHILSAFVAKRGSLADFGSRYDWPAAVELPQGLEIMPVDFDRYLQLAQERGVDAWGTDDLSDLMKSLLAEASVNGPVALILTDYHGGNGSQAAAVYNAGQPTMEYRYASTGPINSALRMLGVVRDERNDEFDTVGLGMYRSTDALMPKDETPELDPLTNNLRLVPRGRQRMGGLFIALLGAGFWIWTWHTRLEQQQFDMRAALLFPAFCILGLGLVLFPGYNEERFARGETQAPEKPLQLITKRWWIITALALLCAVANLLLLMYL